MKKKLLLAALLVIVMLFSNVMSVLVTYNLAKTQSQSNAPTCPTNTVTPTEVLTTNTIPQTTNSVDNKDTKEITLVEIDSTPNSKIYIFSGHTIEIPNTYKISLETSTSILIEPRVKRLPTHFNHIVITGLVNPLEIYNNSAWEPSLDGEVNINGEIYRKIASIFGEGGEMTGNIRDWESGEITYHTFYRSLFITESIGASATNYDTTKYKDWFKDFVLSPDGQQLVKEMDDILGSLKVAE